MPASQNSVSVLFLLIMFHFMQDPCQEERCGNNGDCIPDFENYSYSCDCRPGFAGKHCERRGTSVTPV